MKKHKWYFEIINDWDYIVNGQSSMIHIELLSVHWDKNERWFTVVGISFVWKKPAYQKLRKK